MLVKTVENLEKNALDRVDTLDSVLRKKTAENESVSNLDLNVLVVNYVLDF